MKDYYSILGVPILLHERERAYSKVELTSFDESLWKLEYRMTHQGKKALEKTCLFELMA